MLGLPQRGDRYYYLDVIIFALVSIIVSYFIIKSSLAWTNPTASPPSGFTSTPVSANTIIYFNDTTCPAGWTEVSSAWGRYIVGLPSPTSTLAGTAGTALTNREDRNLGTHTHTAGASSGGHTHSAQGFGGGDQNGLVYGSNGLDFASESPSVTVSALSLPSGTPAPYIQFLVCQKV